LQDNTGKISGACSIKSFVQGFSLYKPQHSARTLGKSPVSGGALPDFCRIFHQLKRRRVLHSIGASSCPWPGLICYSTCLGRAFQAGTSLWRGSLLPLGCAAVAKPVIAVLLKDRDGKFGSASQPSGSKLPRHREWGIFEICASTISSPSPTTD
jgi:hypothetical protein